MRRDTKGMPAVTAVGLILLAAFVAISTKAKSIPDPVIASSSGKSATGGRASGDSSEFPEVYSVGVAQIDITPDYPIRLAGFAKRTTESEGVWLPITAKALTISRAETSDPVVLICVESGGVPAAITDEVAKRLEKSIGLKKGRLSITSTHTHSAPMLRGMSPTLFGAAIPDEHWKNIDRYTAELTEKLEKVAVAAFQDRVPSKLMWGIGAVNFAVNRRTKGGPVDRDLPVLAVKGTDGKIKAIYVNYACHCVTLSSNKISGDWAGYAQDLIQREFPTAIALVSIGCGADQNPSSGVTTDKTDVAEKQGAEIAAEVKRLLGGYLAPIHGDISAARDVVSLDFDNLPMKADWEKTAKQDGAIGYHAQTQLDRLRKGQKPQTSLSYPIVSWTFGDSLAMTFLPGEAVVDYALRLKKELDGRRLWVNSYSNDVPCYIPSERILHEGGYEATGAMIYYDRPGPLKSGVESKIVSTVHKQLAAKFTPPFDPNKTHNTLPKSPQQSLTTMQTTPNLRVDLVAAEPLISSPVAIDFALDGGLWVAEMRDYPTGFPKLASEKSRDGSDSDTHVGPGGRIKILRDSDGDGQFDTSTVFLDNLPMPTGVTVWRKGALICSAPDILYAEDTDGDDKADKVTKLFTGFRNTNIQARVNSLSHELDGWMHGSCGLAGGTITNFKGETFALGNRDFRMKPETGEFEAATGITQQGLSRDNFGNWFGCDNLNLAFSYPLPERYLKRNPYIASPPSRYNLIQTEDDARLFPSKADALRFQLSGAPGTVTAACGLGVYRDTKLGPEYAENLFVCEPVNLLVHRIIPKPQGCSFAAQRAPNEAHTEFLRSSDSWSRPVQSVMGPDGAIWVVDMYRFIIENPRWIPDEERAPLDVRAGTSLGRIYRVRKADDQTPPATRGIEVKNPRGEPLPHVVQSPVYRELELDALIESAERARAEGRKLEVSPLKHPIPTTPVEKIDRLRELAARGQVLEKDVLGALQDPHPGVRAFGLFLAEEHLPKNELVKEIVDTTNDAETHVRLQAALSLGQWTHDQVGPLLAKMALKDAGDPYLVAAIYSSVNPKNLDAFTKTLFDEFKSTEPPASLLNPFLVTAVGYSNDAAVKLALNSVALKGEESPKAWQMNAMANLAQSLAKRPADQPTDPGVQSSIQKMQEAARSQIKVDNHDEDVLKAAMNVLGRDPSRKQQDADLIAVLLSSAQSPAIQIAAIGSLERIAADNIADVLEEHMRELSPSAQNQAIDTMTNREPWLHKILDGIKAETIPIAAMTINQRQELLGHHNKEIRERAQALLAGGINSNRQQVVQQYHAATEMNGDLERGKAVFVKTCAQCHRLGDLGHAVGPNLAMVSSKSPGFLLQEILDPNRNVDSRFTSYIAVTKDGISKMGILSSESSTSVTLLAGEGKKITLLRQDLDVLKSSGKSLMPEGFEKDLPPQAVADVIAFLKSVPALSKKFEGNEPAVIKPVSGRLDLLAEKASIIGDQIRFDASLKTVGSWTATQDQVFWSVELPESAAFDVYLDYACDADSAGNGYLVEAGSSTLSGQIESTGGGNQYVSKLIGSLVLPAGSHRIVMRPDGTTLKATLANLKGLRLVPTGEQPIVASTTSTTSAEADVNEIARQILDDSKSEDERKALVLKHPTIAPQLIVAMTANMPNDMKEEYRRIPWIWRVAVACGRRNQIDQMRPVLDVSLPKAGEPLKDWESVVIGGGIVNGVGLVGAWPKTRMEEILKDQPDLTARWKRTLELSAEMTEDPNINTGTRYDAMRILAMDDREDRRHQLVKYLPKGTHDELQMGAISGLGDIDWPEVSKLLLDNIGHFNEENRNYAIGAMLKLDYRREALLDAIANGRVSASMLTEAHKKELRESKDPTIRVRAVELLGP